MKFKNVLFTLMATVLISSSVLSGCGKKQTDVGQADNSGKTEEVPATAEAEGKEQNTASGSGEVETIKVWSNSGHAKDFFTEAVEEFNNGIGKEKGIFVEIESFGADYAQMAEAALASGQAAPIMQYPPAKTPDAIAKNQFIPLADMPGGEELIAKYEPYIQEQSHKYDGVVYGLPFNTNTIKMVYNKDLFREAGLVDENGEAAPPKTWNEVVEYAKKLTDPKAKVYGIALPMKWNAYFDWELIHPFATSTGSLVFDHENGVFDFENIKPALEFLMQIKEDQSYFPGPESLDNDPARAQFSEGRIGMKLGASWDVGVYNDQFPAKCDWGVADIPVIDESGQRYIDWSESVAYWKISAAAKECDPDKLMEVYKFLNSDELLIKAYEEGKFIPYSSELIDKANSGDSAKGWAEFAQGTILAYPKIPSVTVEGQVYTEVMMKVFSGEIAIEDAVKDLNERYNAALEKAKTDGKINLDNFLIPEMKEEYKVK